MCSVGNGKTITPSDKVKASTIPVKSVTKEAEKIGDASLRLIKVVACTHIQVALWVEIIGCRSGKLSRETTSTTNERY